MLRRSLGVQDSRGSGCEKGRIPRLEILGSSINLIIDCKVLNFLGFLIGLKGPEVSINIRSQ